MPLYERRWKKGEIIWRTALQDDHKNGGFCDIPNHIKSQTAFIGIRSFGKWQLAK